jgi:hypothetical protein
LYTSSLWDETLKKIIKRQLPFLICGISFIINKYYYKSTGLRCTLIEPLRNSIRKEDPQTRYGDLTQG